VTNLVGLERTARALGADVGRDLAGAIDRAGPRLVRADPPVGDSDECIIVKRASFLPEDTP